MNFIYLLIVLGGLVVVVVDVGVRIELEVEVWEIVLLVVVVEVWVEVVVGGEVEVVVLHHKRWYNRVACTLYCSPTLFVENGRRSLIHGLVVNL